VPGSVEAFLTERGAAIRSRAVAAGKGGAILEVTAEDLDGWSAPPLPPQPGKAAE
jgi:hypothetical protein